jgi:hypothetical protein
MCAISRVTSRVPLIDACIFADVKRRLNNPTIAIGGRIAEFQKRRKNKNLGSAASVTVVVAAQESTREATLQTGGT